MPVPNLADVTERLLAEFDTDLDLSVISHVVLEARHELAGTPAGAVPALVERLARQRLLDLRAVPAAAACKATEAQIPPRPNVGR